MPIYEYRCTSCGHSVEVVHAISGIGPETCEVCGGAMKKALSAPAIHFKGSGWAKKDARSAASSKASTAATDGAKDGAAADGKGGGSADAAADVGTGAAASPATGASGSGSPGSESSTSTKPSTPAGKARAGSGADRSA